MMMNDRLFIVTGGPGAGKTTLLLELERRGFRVSHEVARQIIQEQVAANGNALPWADTRRYTELMLERSIAAYRQSSSTEMVFMDRGILDVACYVRLIGLPLFEELQTACHVYRYNLRVFLAPPWQEIYATDSERKQTYAEAVATYKTMAGVYREYGYQPIELPKTDPQQRADFILAMLAPTIAVAAKEPQP
ncbi:MAG TPA: AAA family ATPase [Bryobacteraceae bacterium]